MPVDPATVALLLVAGMLAGAIGAITGLASVVSMPALLSIGLPPVVANATNTVAVLGSTVGAVISGRKDLRTRGLAAAALREPPAHDDPVALLAATAAGGSVLGTVLLLSSPTSAFQILLPLLVATGATLVLLPLLPLPARRRRSGRATRPFLGVALAGAYAGYAAAGAGLAMHVVLDRSEHRPLVRTIALRNLCAGTANVVAATLLAVAGPVAWLAVAFVFPGAVLGSLVGPRLIRHAPDRAVRVVIALAAYALAWQLIS